jgi:RNA polymerase sigma-70 factor, ECF subfamily
MARGPGPVPSSGMEPNDEVWAYRDDLERLARYLCRHREDAEDVAQNAMLKAAEKLDGFRAESTMRTWLHTITTNECRMLRRRKQASSLDDLLEQVAGSGVVGGEAVDPEELALELETRSELLRALEQLPEAYRVVLILKEGREMSLEEVAAALDTTIPAIKSLLYRARKALRTLVEVPGPPGSVAS